MDLAVSYRELSFLFFVHLDVHKLTLITSLTVEGVGATGCDDQYQSQIGNPIPEDDSVCWEIQRFGYTDSPVPVPTQNPTLTPRPTKNPVVVPDTPQPTESSAPTPDIVTPNPTANVRLLCLIFVVELLFIFSAEPSFFQPTPAPSKQPSDPPVGTTSTSTSATTTTEQTTTSTTTSEQTTTSSKFELCV